MWQEDEIERLRDLYSEFKDSDDVMSNIVEGMPMKRSQKRIIEKMLEIGLIEDKSQVRKKRVRGSKKGKLHFIPNESEGGEGE